VEVLARVKYFGALLMAGESGWKVCLHLALEAFFVDSVNVLLRHDAEEHAVEFGLKLCLGRMIFSLVHVPYD
jgi:hypothetical protein